MVVLYSCDKGACDDATLERLRGIVTSLPPSPVCQIPPGCSAPVVARFEQMPTKFAALVWDRALYMDVLDTDKINEFYTRYSERVDSEGNFLAPPEQQCARRRRARRPARARRVRRREREPGRVRRGEPERRPRRRGESPSAEPSPSAS